MSDTYLLPASLTQRRLWLLDQLGPGAATYNIAWLVSLDGPLDVAALEAALTRLVARHESLRTHFTAVDGEPAQVVEPAGPVRLHPVDAGEDWRRHVDEAARRPFDLAAGPLTRFTLLRRPDGSHALVWVVHHAVADGWSFGVLFGELTAAYAGEALPDAPMQYGDFAIWQREQARLGAFDDDLTYWHRALTGAPVLLDLPADRPRPAEQDDAGGTVTREVPPELTARLRQGTGTVLTPLLAGFQALLHRLTGQDDLLVALPVAARTRPRTRDVVGFFANTLALRAVFPAGVTFGQLLAAARDSVAAAQTRQEAPFEQVVERLAVPRSLAHPPLVQVMFALEEAPPSRTAAGLRVTPRLWENGTVKFDLTLTVEDRPAGLRLRVTYRSGLFDEARIRALTEQYLALLAAGLDRPETPVATVPLLGEGDRARLRAYGTGDAVPAVADLSRLTGDAIAVSGPDGELSYRELDARANRLAHLLRAHGAGPDTPVGLALGRGTWLVAAILAVWRAGAGYLPLDPSLPPARIATMLADARPPVVLTDGPFDDPHTRVVRVDTVDADRFPASGPPRVEVHPDALAYLLYTSGSTGRPKGVAVSHAAVTDLLAGFRTVLGLTAADRVAAVTTHAFDISVVELVLPLLAGARIEMIDADTARDAALLRAALADRRVTVAQGTPATWRMLVTAGGVPPGVRLRISGGEALSRDLADRLRDGGTVINGYGPSETTVYSTAGPVGPDGPVSLGRPTPNTTVHLLDPAGQPVPEGVVGELHIGGPGVARGYLGQAGATAARFRPDPYRPGGRLYATGDLGRWRSDGTLDFLGRADAQLKVRGFRIEPGEIETLLREHPAVTEAVVTARGGGRLAAYVVTTGGWTAAELWPQLRAGITARLPDYMIPAALVVLDALPRTASGKADRAALPEPSWRETTGAPAVLARTPVEERLSALWREVLNLPEVGVHDNFFALGGHSLNAARLIARIRTAFGADVTLRDLFAAPTVAELAPLLDRATRPASPLTGPARPAPDRLPDSLDSLSDDEIDALLDALTSEEES
ncbi:MULTISPECIES: non-ribosomal peptide synthetase [Catenuloplanes]|uniref:Amino acid adenylation domain-containing protein n=1 Tax=Catenuloplanes niger TaxID=587534 RepID=A0AAE4A0H5_9ACTN|nr:amino acid adenylation domain-containing protein [Catenuloplanes niger]